MLLRWRVHLISMLPILPSPGGIFRLSDNLCGHILRYMNSKYPKANFSFSHITCDDATFNNLFLEYPDIYKRFEVSNPIHEATEVHFSNFEKLRLFIGDYVGMYVCTNPLDKNDAMIAVDRFSFEEDGPSRAINVIQYETPSSDNK